MVVATRPMAVDERRGEQLAGSAAWYERAKHVFPAESRTRPASSSRSPSILLAPKDRASGTWMGMSTWTTSGDTAPSSWDTGIPL